jgi:hypothetical protein
LTGEPSCNDADHDYHEKTFTRHVHLRKLPEAEDWGELPGGSTSPCARFPAQPARISCSSRVEHVRQRSVAPR